MKTNSAVPWHGIPGSHFTYTAPLRAPTALELELTLPHNIRQTAYASSVWEAELLLSDAITSGEVDVKGKRVLELGAGAGLSGLVALKMGAASVSRSDAVRSDLPTSISG